MKIVKRFLNDVLLLRPDLTRDSVGAIVSYALRDLQAVGITERFVQDNHSKSAVNVLRGLHYQIQHPQGKLIRVLSGCIYDVAVDLRRSSVTFGQHVALNLKSEDGLLLWIPPGYAHGFLVLNGSADVIYSVTDYRYAEYERTLLWSDKRLAIDWPISQQPFTLSEKDHIGTSFAKCEKYD